MLRPLRYSRRTTRNHSNCRRNAARHSWGDEALHAQPGGNQVARACRGRVWEPKGGATADPRRSPTTNEGGRDGSHLQRD